jgi:tetratricopeptide (TPR) repeat protein
MNEAKCAKASRKHTNITILGIASLVLLMLVNIAVAVQSSNAWVQEGSILTNSGKYTEAITAYDKAIEIDPRYFEAWTNKGVDLVNLNKYDEAKVAYDRGIKINPAWEGKKN